MALEQHLSTLRKRHMQLDLEIMAEQARPSHGDRDRILGRLKKQKLALKDDINRLTYADQAA